MIKNESQKKFYYKHRKKRIQESLEYYHNNKDNVLKRMKINRMKNKLENPEEFVKKQRESYRKNYQRNGESMRESSKLAARKRREIVLFFYGGNPPKCACCGEMEIKFLTLDHINNDGAKHRRELWKNNKKGGNLCQWLITNNFPKGFQILCYNCNCAKGFYGKCPHQDKGIIKHK